MALTISKGKIFVDIAPEELLRYFGINMVQIINATILAMQEFTGDCGNCKLYLSDIKGNEEQLLDSILYEVKKDVLESIGCEISINNTEYDTADFLAEDEMYQIIVNGIPSYVYESKNFAIDEAFSMHNNGESDVRVEDSRGNILWDSTYINPEIKSQINRRLYEKRKNQNCDD